MPGITSTSTTTYGAAASEFSGTAIVTAGGTTMQSRDVGAEQVPPSVQSEPLPGMVSPEPFNIRDLLGVLKYASDEEIKFLTLQAGTDMMRTASRLQKMYAEIEAHGQLLASKLKQKAAEEMEDHAQWQELAGLFQSAINISGSAASLLTAFNGARQGALAAVEDGKLSDLRLKGNQWLEGEFNKRDKGIAEQSTSGLAQKSGLSQKVEISQKSAIQESNPNHYLDAKESSLSRSNQANKTLSGESSEAYSSSRQQELNPNHYVDAKAPSHSRSNRAGKTSSSESSEEYFSAKREGEASNLERSREASHASDSSDQSDRSHSSSYASSASSERSTSRSYSRSRSRSESSTGAEESGAESRGSDASGWSESSYASSHTSSMLSESSDGSASYGARSVSRSRSGSESSYGNESGEATSRGSEASDWSESSYVSSHTSSMLIESSDGSASYSAHSVSRSRSGSVSSAGSEESGSSSRSSDASARSGSLRSSSSASSESSSRSSSETTTRNKRAREAEVPESKVADQHGSSEIERRGKKSRIETSGHDKHGWTKDERKQADNYEQNIKKLTAKANENANDSMALAAASNSAGGLAAAPLTYQADMEDVERTKLEAEAQRVEAYLTTIAGSKDAEAKVFEDVRQMVETTQRNSTDSMRLSA